MDRRKPDLNARTAADVATDVQRAVNRFDKPLHEREPEHDVRVVLERLRTSLHVTVDYPAEHSVDLCVVFR